jgi:hypothetical protein
LAVDEFAYHGMNSTLWGWGNQNPIRWSDPTGRDIWIEGGSPGEGGYGLHQSINVGNPNGDYVSYSFGWDPTWYDPFRGSVYVDTNHGGDIDPDSYLYSTPQQDQAATELLDSLIGTHDLYFPGGNSCREFSQAWSEAFSSNGYGEPGPPPPRSPANSHPWSPTLDSFSGPSQMSSNSSSDQTSE